MAALLETTGLEASYGRAQVLFGLDLALQRGEVLALLGRNGAGKSTTLKAIMGLVPRRSGRISFDGNAIQALAPFRIARRGIGYVPEDRRIFTELSVAQNLDVARQKPRDGVPEWTPERLYALFPSLGALRHRLGGRMSGGEQQMLTIARTLMGNPALLLLDEPSEGLAPRIVGEIAEMILALKREGLTILLSEQNMRFAGHVADSAAIIEQGRIAHLGPIAEIAADTALQRRYLGA